MSLPVSIHSPGTHAFAGYNCLFVVRMSGIRRGLAVRSLLTIAVLFGARIHSVGLFGVFLFTVIDIRRLSD